MYMHIQGYKSEAKKPKNTFIAQWDRKGFEHSYRQVFCQWSSGAIK